MRRTIDAIRLLGDDLRALHDLLSLDLAIGDHLGPRRDHRQRRSEVVDDPRRRLADGLQPVHVAQLGERGDVRGGLLRDPVLRVVQVRGHGVHLRRERPDLVPLLDDDSLGKIAAADAARAGDQLANRAADEHHPKEEQDDCADDDHHTGRDQHAKHRRPDETLHGGERLGQFDGADAEVLHEDGHGRVQDAPAVAGLQDTGHLATGGERLLVRLGDEPSLGDLVAAEPTHADPCHPLVDPLDETYRDILSLGDPGLGNHGSQCPTDRQVIVSHVVLEQLDLALYAEVPIDEEDDEDSDRHHHRDFQGELHLLPNPFTARDGGWRPRRP
jgi:hypothetical protein